MKEILKWAIYRLVWAGIGLNFALCSFWEFSQERNAAPLIDAAGWVLLSAAWFMHPTILRNDFRQSLLASREYVIGPAYLRYVSLFGGLTLLIAGLTLRLVHAISI